MKNIMKTLFTLFFIFLITGCNEKKLICTKSATENGITTKENVEVIFKKDKPINTNMVMKMNFNSNTKSQIDTTYNSFKTLSNKFDETKGVEISIKKENDIIKFSMNVDFKEVKNSKDLGLEFSEKDNYVNIRDNFKNDGYICD